MSDYTRDFIHDFLVPVTIISMTIFIVIVGGIVTAITLTLIAEALLGPGSF